MDSLAARDGNRTHNIWIAVAVFAALRLAASDSGIGLVRQWLWIPIRYYSQDALTRAAYSHVIHLSADFHDTKSYSDKYTAIEASQWISNGVESVLLQAAPMMIDMCVALMYLSITFGPYEGFITLATGAFFFITTGKLLAGSNQTTRQRTIARHQETDVRSVGLQGWQTASAFNRIAYEDTRHADAVTKRWNSEKQYMFTSCVSVAFQTVVLTSGLLASAFLAVYRIQNGKASPGQFAMLLMYWSQLTGPLQFFAGLGRNMSSEFIAAERLRDLFKTKPTVQNNERARPLELGACDVTFDKVTFSYDGKKNT
jgi:ABC-type transport system involved in Fe-S cluster assembly fused permease/ATPase subunit